MIFLFLSSKSLNIINEQYKNFQTKHICFLSNCLVFLFVNFIVTLLQKKIKVLIFLCVSFETFEFLQQPVLFFANLKNLSKSFQRQKIYFSLLDIIKILDNLTQFWFQSDYLNKNQSFSSILSQNTLHPFQHTKSLIQNFKTQEQSCLPQSMNLPESQKASFNLQNQNKSQCLFSILPCSSKSKQLKTTIDDEKIRNEQFFELSSIKHVVQNAKTLKPKEQKQKQKIKQCKDYRKGICFTDRKDNQQKVYDFQTIKFENNTSIMKNSSQQKPSFHYQSDSKTFESQGKSFHRLNPLYIDKNIYENQVKLGGKKQTLKLRQVQNLQNLNHHEKVNFSYVQTDQRTSLPWKSKVNFYSTNHSFTSQSIPQSANKLKPYPVNFSYETQYSQQKQMMKNQRNSLKLSFKNFAQKHANQQFVNRNTFSYTQRRQDGRIFENSYVQNTLSVENNALFKSNFSNHSQKYRNYMGEQLLTSTNFPQGIKDRESISFSNKIPLPNEQQCYLQHNQKIQNHPYKIQQQHTTRHIPIQRLDNKSRSHLVYSLLTVTSNRQKQIQSARDIYNNFGYILSDSIQTSKQLKQPNDNNTFQQMDQTQNQNGYFNQAQNSYDLLTTQITQLSTQLSLLKTQEGNLHNQNQSLTNKSLLQLNERIQQLQTLKQLSVQRSVDIETLRQFIRVKKIFYCLNSNKNAYETYLKDQNSWNRYIDFNGNFNELYQSNQTSETHNQQGLIVQN